MLNPLASEQLKQKAEEAVKYILNMDSKILVLTKFY